MIRKILRPFKFLKSLIPQWVLNQLDKRRDRIEFENWRRNGSPLPPPHFVKQMAILEYKDRYQYDVLVETGTYKGDMVEAQRKNFKRIYSIELGVDLFNKATRRFRKYQGISIVQGDSGKVLPKILLEINEPAIFWLDGHYSADITAKGEKECPIFEELDAILNSKKFNHVLLIDDARCFIGKGDYPTIDQLTAFIKSKEEKYQVEVRQDIIRYVI